MLSIMYCKVKYALYYRFYPFNCSEVRLRYQNEGTLSYLVIEGVVPASSQSLLLQLHHFVVRQEDLLRPALPEVDHDSAAEHEAGFPAVPQQGRREAEHFCEQPGVNWAVVPGCQKSVAKLGKRKVPKT